MIVPRFRVPGQHFGSAEFPREAPAEFVPEAEMTHVSVRQDVGMDNSVSMVKITGKGAPGRRVER